MDDMDRHIRKALKDVLTYIGGIDLEYVDNAQLHTYLEWLIKKAEDIKGGRLT